MIIGLIAGAAIVYAIYQRSAAKQAQSEQAYADLCMEAQSRGVSILDIIQERNNAYMAQCQARLAELEAKPEREIKWY